MEVRVYVVATSSIIYWYAHRLIPLARSKWTLADLGCTRCGFIPLAGKFALLYTLHMPDSHIAYTNSGGLQVASQVKTSNIR